MDPLTVLLWLLCVFIVAVIFGVIGLIIYMIKERKKSIQDFNLRTMVASGPGMYLENNSKFQNKMHAVGNSVMTMPSDDNKTAMHKNSVDDDKSFYDIFTTGPSQGG